MEKDAITVVLTQVVREEFFGNKSVLREYADFWPDLDNSVDNCSYFFCLFMQIQTRMFMCNIVNQKCT